jgi:hypothetical protein
VLSLYRELIALRRTLAPDFELLQDAPGLVSFRRGDRLVTVNLSRDRCRIPPGETLLATEAGAVAHDGSLAPHAGALSALA